MGELAEQKRPSRLDFLKWGAAGIAGAAVLGVSGCSWQRSAAEAEGVRTLTYAYEQAPGTSHSIAADVFQQALEEVSGGAMSISQYPSGQLGGEPGLLQKVLAGDIDLISASTANAAQLSPQSGVFSLHYLYESKAHVLEVVSDPQVNDLFKQLMESTVSGAQPLTLFASPFRNLYSQAPVRSVEDIQGAKIRVQATRTEDIFFTEYGAQVVHMAFPEVYTSLQTGVVDMAENAIMYYVTGGHYEVAPVMSMSQHEGDTLALWVSDSTLQELSEQERGWLQTAADEVSNEATSRAFDVNGKYMREVRSEGVEFFDNIDVDSFREIAEPLQEPIAKDLGQGATQILRRVRELQ